MNRIFSPRKTAHWLRKHFYAVSFLFVWCTGMATCTRGFAQTFTQLTGTPVSAVQALGFGTSAWGDYDSDGDLDFIVTGNTGSSTSTRASAIYRNDNGTFVDINAGLPGVSFGKVAWGDYDNDGDLDLVLTGQDDSAVRLSRIYRNDNGTFTDINASLPGVNEGTVEWGDYDHDGDLDLLLAGNNNNTPISKVYRNDSGTFTDIGAGLTGVRYSAGSWSDYDNDGDLDILLTGQTLTTSYTVWFYRNDSGIFTGITSGLTGVRFGSVVWGDYDNDGDQDLALAGESSFSNFVSHIYRNDNGTLTNINASLQVLYRSSASWGDCDNDGDLDLLIAGATSSAAYTKLYRNDSGTFNEVSAGLTGVFYGNAAWGDYDSDHDLDILLSGRIVNSANMTRIYTNSGVTANTAPSAPILGTPTVSGGNVTLNWTASTDTQTPSAGLTYNVYVGTSSGGIQEVTPHANLASGQRRLPAWGNALLGTSFPLKCLANGTYYYSVQAIDNGLRGSAFASQGTFTVTNGATAPTVSSFSPADNASNIGISSNLVITFSESISKGTGNLVIRKVSDDSAVETFDVASSSAVTVSNNAVTINPTTDLSYGANYYVEVPATAFKNSCQLAYAGASGKTTWNFATTAPAISLSATSFSGFEAASSYASPSRTYTVSGSELVTDVTVTPSTGYEVSSNGNTWSDNITLTPGNGTLNATPVYVRLKSGLSAGTVNGTISHTSTGATTRTVNLDGTVVAVPVAYVRPDGNDTNNGFSNTSSGAKRTLQSALNVVDDGGTVSMTAGTYPETATNTKTVTLQPSGTVNLQTLVMNGTGKTLTLGSTLNISEKLALQAGTVASGGNLVLLSTASNTALIDDFSAGYTGTITGNITAQRYVSSATSGYRYLASPVTGATIAQLGTIQYPSYYDETKVTAASTSIDAGWVAIPEAASLISPVQGISGYYNSGTQTFALAGTANTGNFAKTVTRTTSGNFAGYHVIGNPYPSPVSWSAIWTLNNNTDIHKTVYVWNNSLGKAAMYNFATGIAANGGLNEIAQGQAFRIRVNTVGHSSVFNLDNTVRLATSTNTFFRKEAKEITEKLRLVLSSEENKEGYETVIHAVNDATAGIDAAYDGEFAGDQAVAVIYSKAEGEKMTINALPELEGERTVALGVEVQQAGQYTISATEIENFAPGTAIYIEDRKLNKLVDLTIEPSYAVQLNQSEANRFFVHFNAIAKETWSISSFVNVYTEAKEVTVQFSDANAAKGTIAIVNMLGQTVAEVQTEKGQQVAVLKLDVIEGVYIVKVSSESVMLSRKVMISSK